MITDIRLDRTQEVCTWILNFCLKNSLEEVQNGDLGRAEAFSRVAIVLLGLLDEGSLEKDKW